MLEAVTSQPSHDEQQRLAICFAAPASQISFFLSDADSKKEKKETLSGSLPLTAFPTRASYDFVALRLLYSYTIHAGTDLFDGRNAASLQVLHASSMMTNLWIYRSIYTIKHEFWAAEYCSSVVHALLPSLENNTSTPVVHDIVGRACCILNEMACAGVSGRAGELLEGIEERARASRIRVPAYGRQEADEEAHGGGPMIMLRGVRVFDGAEGGEGGMLDGADGRHNVRFGKTIADISRASAKK